MRPSRLLIPFFALLALGLQASALWFFTQIFALRDQNPGTTAFIKDYQARHPQPATQHFVPYAQIATALKQAVITAEDDRFVDHQGFDWIEIRKAMQENWQARRVVRGGSGISQQLVKNLFLSPQQTPWRKVQELPLTWMLERTLSKQRIFELYLNSAEWGAGLYGIEAAAQHYFQRPAHSLTPAQAAKLAAMLPNPRFYQQNPHHPRLLARARHIEQRMHQARIP